MSGEFLIEMDEVTAGYGTTPVLQRQEIAIARGERVALLGRNGAGKSTLLATLMGRTKLFRGTIRFRGEDISRLPIHRRAALGIGLVPQDHEIFATLTVEENLRAARNSGAAPEDAYEMFPRLAETRRARPQDLTRDELQMLTIARTLMMRPELLLLDEPLEGIAPLICEQIMRNVAELASGGHTTVILVDQHVDIALAFATRAVLMDNGRIVHDSPAAALKTQPDILERHVGSL